MKFIKTLNFFSLLWFLCLLGALAYQAYLGWHVESNDTTNIYLQLGRVAAYCLLIIMALCWLPVMRNSLTWLSQFPISQLLPIRRVKSLHQWLGHALMAFALLHASQYLVYYTTLEEDFLPVLVGSEPDLVRSMKTTMYEFVSEDESIEMVDEWIREGRAFDRYQQDIAPLMKEDCTKCHSKDSTMTYAINTLPLQTYEEVISLSYQGWQSRQFRINMSGLVMFSLFAVMWFTSLLWFRKKHFHAFRQLHRLGYLIAILSLLHIPRLEWLFAPCLVLFIELLINHSVRRYNHIQAHIDSRLPHFIIMHLPLPAHVHNKAGHYVQIKSHQLSDKDWHDFSLTGLADEQGRAIIKIQKVGDWTKELTDFSTLTVHVRGAWASPMAYSQHKRNWILVAGGIGITPIFSLLQAWLLRGAKNKQITILWVLRDAPILAWLQPLLPPLMNTFESSVKIELYLTSGQPFPDWLTALSGENLRLHTGRPDFTSIYKNQRFTAKPTIFTCGPKSMMNEAKKAGKQLGWKSICEQF
ncbi:ferric reductase family protein [Photobacterium japonica]|uniref:ferric reductase family protein n=1 Tax=Photobacterium japonica TaxID=2910235 RepID=UPI003D10F6E6